jgi:hypothetical protein
MAARGKEVLMLARRLTLALFTLALGALPLACGGESLSPQAAVAQAATKYEEAGSSRVSMSATIKDVPGGPFTFTGEGEFDRERGHMTMDMSSLGEATGGAFAGEMEMILEDLVMYMKFPAAITRQLPRGKSWVRIDLREAGKELGIDLEELMQVQQSDPTQSLQYLRGASDDFEEVGEEEVRGVATTHYRGTIDLRKAAEQLPGKARETFERATDLIGTVKLPFDVWIDDDGLARRMKYEQPLPSARGQAGAMELTMELFDFGVDVDIEPPPNNEVIDIQELIRAGS